MNKTARSFEMTFEERFNRLESLVISMVEDTRKQLKLFNADGPTCDEAPAKKKRESQKLPNFLRLNEQAVLLAKCASEVALLPRTRSKKRLTTGKRIRAAKRDELIVHLGIRLGLRVSEIINLEIEHLDFAGGMALVYQGKGSRDRMIPIADDLSDRLQAWIGERTSGPVLLNDRGTKMSDVTILDRMRRLGKLAGIARHLKPHTLRHTAAVRMVETGAAINEVKEFLGHSSIATTDVYLHTVPERLRAAVNRAAGVVLKSTDPNLEGQP